MPLLSLSDFEAQRLPMPRQRPHGLGRVRRHSAVVQVFLVASGPWVVQPPRMGNFDQRERAGSGVPSEHARSVPRPARSAGKKKKCIWRRREV